MIPTIVIWCGIGGALLALIYVAGLQRSRLLDWIAGFEETINTAISSVRFATAPAWAGPTMALPILEPTWEQRRAAFAAYIDTFAGRVRALTTPTAEYRIVVAREFGVELTEVGPREAELRCVRRQGLPELAEVGL